MSITAFTIVTCARPAAFAGEATVYFQAVDRQVAQSQTRESDSEVLERVRKPALRIPPVLARDASVGNPAS